MVAFPLPGQFVKRSLDQEIARLAGVRPVLTVSLARNQAWLRGRAMPADAVPGRSHTRASTAYGTTRDGRLISYASGAARDVPGRGQLDEPSRTNLLLRSQELDNASWTKTNCTITANAIAAPDGTLTADKIIVNNGVTPGRPQQVITTVAATAYTFSCFAKAGEWGFVCLRLAEDTAPSVWFDLSTGAVGTKDAGWSSARIEALGDGWYRCIATHTTIGTSYTYRVISTNANGASSTGDGTSGIYAWGTQVEAGAFPTSYIPTTTASATRAADVATIDLLNPGLYDVSGQSELVTNGSFASDTGWTKGTGWTISGGVANASAVPAGASGYLTANGVTAAAGKVYLVTYTVTLSGGGVGFRAGDTSGVARNASGTYTEVLRCSAAAVSTAIGFERRLADFTGTIDNVSIKEIPAEQVIDYPCTIVVGLEMTALNTADSQRPISLGVDANDIVWIQANNTAGSSGSSAAAGGVGQGFITARSVSAGVAYKMALRVAANDSALSVNGDAAVTDATYTLPARPNKIFIGANSSGANILCGYISFISIIPGGVANGNLQRLVA